MNFMLTPCLPHHPTTSVPPPSSPLGPNSPAPRTPTSRRQYKNRDFSGSTPVQENPRRAFLREQFKKRCLERAQKARQDQVRLRRMSSNMLSSDGFEYDDDAEMEEDENGDAEDDVLDDETKLFRRIMASAKHKQQHNFRLSYQLEVGSSVDPDMEDISHWEQELEVTPQKHLVGLSQDVYEDYEDEELAQYAEEFTKRELEEAADEYFDLSDWDGIDDAALVAVLEDQEMQM